MFQYFPKVWLNVRRSESVKKIGFMGIFGPRIDLDKSANREGVEEGVKEEGVEEGVEEGMEEGEWRRWEWRREWRRE